ncbi:MAG: hypothetical protein HOP16_02610 [Acidobacteria bacterium]|nr:hypothetical protein [Acidobacteriota bacterium]
MSMRTGAFIPSVIRTAGVSGLVVLGLAGLPATVEGQGGVAAPPPPRQEPQRSIEIDEVPVFFREDWRYDHTQPNTNNAREPEHPVAQGDVLNPNLEVRLYGDAVGTRTILQPENKDTKPGGGDGLVYVMSLLCGTNLDRDDLSGKVIVGPSTHANCLITLRDRNNDVDLSGVASIKWRTRVSGFHCLRPVLKLASGQWLVGDKCAQGPQTSWAEQEIQFVDVRWRNLNIAEVVEARDGYWVDFPDLSRVEEIGFTDLMRGAGHGSGGGSRIDWLEVKGKPVPRKR